MKAKIKLNNYINNIIKISGSKNSSLPIIASCILCDEDVVINNVPNITDVLSLVKIIRKMGYDIKYINNCVIYRKSKTTKKRFLYNDIKKIRGSYYLIGSLIGNSDFCDFYFLNPGGCKFINRPINYHIDIFRKMGLDINIRNNKIYVKGIKNNIVYNLPYPSVGATINILLSTCKIEKESIIYNCSIEPEVIDVCNFLKSMGCNININIDNRTINIIGKKYFHKTNYTVMEDRIEAGTFLILGAIHTGITIKNANKSHLEPLIKLLRDIGYKITIKHNNINNLDTITLNKENLSDIKPFNVTLDPYPSLPTDLGPILCVLASTIKGTSYITDNVYNNRITHVKQLQKFNVNIKYENNKIIINGNNKIINSKVKSSDLRCCAALILISSLNKKYSYIYNINNIFRGYENIKDKLYYLGISFKTH